jgi:hypothetical protein
VSRSNTLGFEIEGRRLKVERYVAKLLEELEANGIDTAGVGIADGLAKWDRKAWLRFAKRHDLRPPSPDKTVPAILDEFRAREAKRLRGAA